MPMSARLLRPRAAATAGFDPRSLANIELWLDAADVSTLGNAATGPGGASNNGPVRYWGDKSGKGRHATKTGADSVCPTLLLGSQNGNAAISFDGGDDVAGTWNVTLTQQTAFIVVLYQTASQNFARTWTQSTAANDFDAGGYVPFLARTSAEGRIWWHFLSGATWGRVAATEAVMNVVSARHTGSQAQLRVNNGAAQLDSHTLNRTFTRYLIGRDTISTGYLVGRICEIIVYSRSVSDGELTAVSRYLGKKWGVTVS